LAAGASCGLDELVFSLVCGYFSIYSVLLLSSYDQYSVEFKCLFVVWIDCT